ncbi:ATP-binding protein [Pseudonocardia asaccharolytica]|uniref:Histidine kinase/HSP90-like ATPase domain-containing protein n=1 Tax=Pseudonocardia asaccharolytica DSM 44247 = NBRC 16224 TaxID=1123024 RepID=A0A511DCM1_9PSEU|nr:ATP-binding protein [Pseudonocardia asaccharolytica]GEL20708.1 hypothetical protein PA7_45450 [Pseudonocardia asaccharolytica DSM 44247 = NBRC 16224]
MATRTDNVNGREPAGGHGTRPSLNTRFDATEPLELHHHADPHELRAIRAEIADWADRTGLPDHTLVDLQLAVGEAVANSVEHAYRGRRPGTVDVRLDVHRRGAHRVVNVRIADRGRWHSRPRHSGNRGRGLFLIGELAEQVRVTPSLMGTEVRFTIPIGN